MTPKMRNIIIIVVLGIIILVVLIIAIGSVIRSFKKTPDEQDAERVKKSIDKNNVTLKDADFVTMAGQLDSAFNDTFGTDEDAIYRVFGMLNTVDDLYSLINVFGKKPSDWREIILAPFAAKGDTDLGGWMTAELDEDEIAKVNGILSSKGIKYKF